MTPAINLLKKKKISHEILQYTHSPDAPSYGLEACEKLGLATTEVFKTLVAETDNHNLMVALVPVTSTLNLKALAKAAGCKKAAMAKAEDVQRSTGYILGGVSPLGQKKNLPTFIDSSASALNVMFVSAGRRGLELKLSPSDLASLSRAVFADIACE
ncbi:Cys-tRNA(Pro) deacylase [Aestuariibacter sp. A3R04]|uniref:Cys-tRNA(Pro) deacylase n=1 Tax=Aestuariibacter sp. A3R04 TaxID=2841571 RepID=UPI001C0A0618|nr:Cys-tRNA(Pro) deacylase [Aestuariibacter sp. A3R04]MBU3022655.1 Cys-tRNA(Pro) deacylase [Aestuariibacter sp. A3R04]